MRTPDERIAHLKAIFSKSMSSQRSKVLGKPADPDVELYEKMTPRHFDRIREQYGLEGLLRYIRHVEHKRLTAAGGK